MLRRSPSTLHLSQASSCASAADADVDSDVDAATIAREARMTSGMLGSP